VKLSTADLGLFFDAHHVELAERLVAAAGAIAEAGAADHSGARVAREMGELHGLYHLLLPASGTADVRALCLAREMLGHASPLADAIFAVQGLGSYPILLAGTDAQREALLGRFRSGDLIGAFALTEPEAGSDVASMRTTARRDADAWILDGDKTLISNVGIAGSYVVFANADPAAGRKGITAFHVPADAAGLVATPIAMGIDHPIGALALRGCRVGTDAVLGGVGGGFKLAMQTLDTFRVTVGAAAVGMARRALDDSVARVRGRVQFGKPLAEQQIVQSHLADMATELDAARLLVLRAAHARDTGRERVTTEAAMAKLFATEAAQRIIDTAVQLHGGLGVTSGTAVENLYRSIRPLRIYEGTSEIQRLIIGRALTTP
jgi:acyl-CoA dehydrogenase